MASDAAIIELDDVGKSYGNVQALCGVRLQVVRGRVTCILGDNGAGKSTLIKVISGLHRPTRGVYRVDGNAVHFSSPREAIALGISAVYQDLALVGLMPVWRNFFLGSEITRGFWPCTRLDVTAMWREADAALRRMGIAIDNLDRHVGSLSGGQRQVVAIARAIHFGARVLILDEPTAALGVHQSGLVLKYIATAAREHGVGVVFITHNPHHAHLVGDHFIVLNQGRMSLDAARAEVTLDSLTFQMAGGAGLDAIRHELHG